MPVRGAASPRGETRVGLRCGREGVLLVDAHPGVDRPGITVVAVYPVVVADPREARLCELAGGQLAGGERA